MSAWPLILVWFVLLWAACYFYLAAYYRRWNISGINIHESRNRNLVKTIFFFNHFLREVPVDTLYVLAALWSIKTALPGLILAGEKAWPALLGMFLAFMIASFSGSWLTVGLRNTLKDLFQFRSRDDQQFYGAHWKMHFLSTLVLILIFILPGLLLRGRANRTLVTVILGFSLLSLLFLTGRQSLTDKRWLFHGAREILTFFFLGVVPLFLITGEKILSSPLKLSIETTAVAVAIICLLFYYLLVFVKYDINRVRESHFPPFYLVVSHFFEHFLDFIYMTLLFLILTG